MVADTEYYSQERQNPDAADYIPVYRDADPVDLRQFPNVVYQTAKQEQYMAHLMGGAQVIVIILLGITWYRACRFHREERNLLYLRHAFGEKDKEKDKNKARSGSRSRGNTSGGGRDPAEEDRTWLTDVCDWLISLKKYFKKGTQPDGTNPRMALLSIFQRKKTIRKA